MVPEQTNPTAIPQPANTGNASNPAPDPQSEQENSHQLLNKKAEKYLREAGNIEDLPDAQEEMESKKEN